MAQELKFAIFPPDVISMIPFSAPTERAQFIVVKNVENFVVDMLLSGIDLSSYTRRNLHQSCHFGAYLGMGLSVVSSEYEEIRKQRLEANQRRLQVKATSH